MNLFHKKNPKIYVISDYKGRGEPFSEDILKSSGYDKYTFFIVDGKKEHELGFITITADNNFKVQTTSFKQKGISDMMVSFMFYKLMYNNENKPVTIKGILIDTARQLLEDDGIFVYHRFFQEVPKKEMDYSFYTILSEKTREDDLNNMRQTFEEMEARILSDSDILDALYAKKAKV